MTVQSTTEASEAPAEEVEAPAQAASAEITETDKAPVEDAPDNGTSGEETVLERFRLEDVPEEYREHVERYVKQANGDYTRKMQTLAEQRREVEAASAKNAEWAETIAALDNEETRDTAIAELVSKYGYTVEEAEAEAEAADGAQEDAEFRDPRVDAILEQQEADRLAASEAEQAAAQEAHNDAIMDHVDEALDAFAEANGEKELRPAQRRQIIAIAAALPRLEGDLPNMELAIAEYEAEVAASVTGYLASKRVETPDLSGQTGTPTFDSRDPKQRLAAANRVAEAALARHR